MVDVPWPSEFTPTHGGYYPIESDTSGGQSIGGGEQFVVSPGARWGAQMTFHIWNSERLRAMRVLRSQLKGRANPVLLPNFDRLNFPPGPSPAATFTAAFPIGTTDVTVAHTAGGGGTPAGAQFGTAGLRLYEIEESYLVGAVRHLKIWPPLRRAVALGNGLQFTNAVCLMRCMNMSEQLQALTDLRFATLVLEFEEYF
jgi:hypothetical protein